MTGPMTGGAKVTVVPAVPLLNVANGLTVTRLLLVPVFLVVLFVDSGTTTPGGGRRSRCSPSPR